MQTSSKRFLRPAFVLTLASLWLACSSSDDIPDGGADASAVPDTGVASGDAAGGNDSASAADAPVDAPSDGGKKPIGAGPYSIAYSSAPGIGIDQRPTVTATFGSNGELDGYEASADEKPLRGTNNVGELFIDELSTVGRWNGGTTAGKYYASAGFPFSATEGFHYALVVKSGALPTS